MKTIMLFARISLMMCGIAALNACSEPPVGPIGKEKLGTPEKLRVEAVSGTTAELSWKAVEGAGKYSVVFGDMEAVDVTEASYSATGLTSETIYTWKVRAIKGDVASEWAMGPGFSTLQVTAAPTDLTVVAVTHHTAKVSWKHDNADFHEVMLDDEESAIFDKTECTLIKLDPQTKYTWKVRSCKNDIWSEWAESSFTTTAIPAPINVGFINSRTRYDGHAYMEGTSCIDIIFTDHEYYSDDRSGWLLELDLIIDEIEDGPEKEFLDITPGTYPFSATKGPNIVYLSQYTIVRETLADGYYVQPMPTITGDSLELAAIVMEPISGRILKAYTTEPGMQFYIPSSNMNYLVGHDGKTYGRYYGFGIPYGF